GQDAIFVAGVECCIAGHCSFLPGGRNRRWYSTVPVKSSKDKSSKGESSTSRRNGLQQVTGSRARTSPQYLCSQGSGCPVVQEEAVRLPAGQARQWQSPSPHCPPAHPAQTDIPRCRRSPYRSGGNQPRTQRQSSLQ